MQCLKRIVIDNLDNEGRKGSNYANFQEQTHT
jgi:hypothetical protein